MTNSAEEYADSQIARRPAEAEVIRKIVRAMDKAGKPVVKVAYDSVLSDCVEVSTEQDVLTEAFNLDEAWLVTADGDWALVIMGEDPEDMLADYTLSLEDALGSIW